MPAKKNSSKKQKTDFRRMSGHKYFLTYPKMPINPNLTKEALLEFLQKKSGMGGEIIEYVIGIEKHDPKKEDFDPDRPIHFHAYFCCEKKKSVKSASHFDWGGYHGQYYTVGGDEGADPRYKDFAPAEQRIWVINYCKKDGDFIEMLNEDGANQTDKDTYEKMRESETTGDGMRILLEEKPEQFFKFGKACRDNLEYMHRAKAMKGGMRYDLWEFKLPPLDLTLPAILHGECNCQKTQYAKAHFKNPLVVSTLDELKKFKPGEHDGIVFDDMYFTAKIWNEKKNMWEPNPNHIPPNMVIHLLDMEEDRTLGRPIRNKDAFIPAGTRKIFTHNGTNPKDIFPAGINEAQQGGIDRRIGEMRHVTEPIKMAGLIPEKELPIQERPVRHIVRNVIKNLRENTSKGEIKLGEKPEYFTPGIYGYSPKQCSAAAKALAKCRKTEKS